MSILILVGAALLGLVAAVLAMIETSFTRLAAVGAGALSESDPERAARLEPLLDRTERVLAPVLLLTVACHLGAAALVTVWAHDRFGVGGVAVSVAVLGLFLYLFGEVAPKTLALAESLRVAASVAGVADRVARLPLVSTLARLLLGLARFPRGSRARPVVSEEDLLALAERAVESESIESEERSLIASVFEFGDTIAREVMVPRPDMITLDEHTRVDEGLGTIVEHGYSRLPVTGESIDDVVGIVLSKDLVRAHLEGRSDVPVRSIVRPPRFVPETKRVAELMPEMQAEKFHLAVVVDEYGGTAGIVTLEDLIEELIGEISDEFDVEEKLVEVLGEGDVRISARLSVAELAELIDAPVPAGDWDTVGGLVFNQLGHVPEPGESVEVGGFRWQAEAVDGRRIDLVRVTRVAVPAGHDEGTVQP